MMSAIELEKYVVNASILSIIVSKFCHGKKSCSIILLEVDKDLEVGFHCTILSLSLVVYLRVEGGRKSLLDMREIA